MSDTWLENTTTRLLALDAEIRGLLRLHHYGHAHVPNRQLSTWLQNGPGPGGIKISASEARLLLRGAVPPLPQHRALRRAHASLHLALQRFLDRLPQLSRDPTDGRAIDLGVDLAAVLAQWLHTARWQQATVSSGIKWASPVDIIEVTRPQTETDAEHDDRQLVLPLAA